MSLRYHFYFRWWWSPQNILYSFSTRLARRSDNAIMMSLLSKMAASNSQYSLFLFNQFFLWLFVQRSTLLGGRLLATCEAAGAKILFESKTNDGLQWSRDIPGIPFYFGSSSHFRSFFSFGFVKIMCKYDHVMISFWCRCHARWW